MMNETGKNRLITTVWWLLLAAVILTALLLRTSHLDFGLPQRLHPDEWSQVEVAWRIANGDPNPHFFRYPSAFMYLLAVVFKGQALAIPNVTLPQLYWTGRLAAALLGTAIVLLVAVWGHLLWGQWWGLLAGALLALLYTPIEHSHYATVDGPMVFGASACLLLLSAAASRNSVGWLRLAAVMAGVTMATKYNGALLLAPLTIVTLGICRAEGGLSQHARRAWMAGLLLCGLSLLGLSLLLAWQEAQVLSRVAALTGDGRLEPEYLAFYGSGVRGLVMGGILLLGLAFSLFGGADLAVWCRLFHLEWLRLFLLAGLTFTLLTPYVFVEWRLAARDFFYEMRHMQIGAAAHVSVDDPAYQQILTQTFGLLSNLPAYLAQLRREGGWLAGLFTIPGALLLVKRRPVLAVALLTYGLLVLLTISSWGNLAVRYALPLYPVFCLLAAGGLAAIWNALPRLSFLPLAQTALAAGLAAALLLPAASYSRGALAQFTLPDTRELAMAWLLQQTPAGAKLARDPYALDPGPLQDRFNIQDASPYVLAQFSPADLLKLNVDYVFTTFPSTEVGKSARISAETYAAFLAAYEEMVMFSPTTEISRGRTIFVYQRKP